MFDVPGFLTALFIFQRCDENNWNFLAGFRQLPAQIESGHATKLNIQHQTIERLRNPRLQKVFSGMVEARPEASRPQQAADGPGEAFIIVHHCD